MASFCSSSHSDLTSSSFTSRSPVHETWSTPSGSDCSNATARARYSSSSARKRPTIWIGSWQSATRSRNDAHWPTPRRSQQLQQQLGLFGHRHLRGVQMLGADHRHRPRGERRRRDLGEAVGVDTEHHLGQQVVVPVLQRHRPRIAAQRGGLQFGEHLGDVLERPVLQQPREQQVAHLEQGQVLLVVRPHRPAAAGPP